MTTSAAPRTHVVGAGLAGLAAAVSLAREGRAVTLHEATGRAGGRCRSWFDARLGRAIDNGNHLLLAGNRAAMRYLADIGAAGALIGPSPACFPFVDVRTGRRWSLRPNAGRPPRWLLDPGRRPPGVGLRDCLRALRLAVAGPDRTVADCVGDGGAAFENFWEPLAVAALNAPARNGSARLLRSVLRDTFARGEAACRPLIARNGLSDAFVDPALAFLREHGVAVRFGRRLTEIAWEDDAARRLHFGPETIDLRRGDRVVLAASPSAAAGLVPALTTPDRSSAIVNVHFRLPEPAGLPADPPFLGLIGGTAQWLFARGDVVSVTVSAADRLAREPAGAVARKTWADVAAALGLDRTPPPACRVIKERNATFAQTPEGARRRPGTRTRRANLFLAGDWIDTGLPATIEGAVRSGRMAARAVLGDGRIGL